MLCSAPVFLREWAPQSAHGWAQCSWNPAGICLWLWAEERWVLLAVVLTTLGRISPKKADVEGETAGAALAPEPCWVLLMGDSGCGAGSAQGSCGFVKKCNCTGGVRVEEFKINPHLHQGPLMLIWAPCRSVLAVHYWYKLLLTAISVHFTVV